MSSDPTGGADDLEAQAEDFAGRLTATVGAVVPGCDPFEAQAQPTDSGGRIAIRQNPDTGVPLKVDGEPLLTLKISYYCSWDAPEQFLAVDESAIKVYAGRKASGEPLFRYEFMRWPNPDVPGAHVQLHAHRDAITHVMARAGRGSRRGRSRADNDAVPTMSELHFPLGGPRFRPCLEDVLEMLVIELGVDCLPKGDRPSARAVRTGAAFSSPQPPGTIRARRSPLSTILATRSLARRGARADRHPCQDRTPVATRSCSVAPRAVAATSGDY